MVVILVDHTNDEIPERATHHFQEDQPIGKANHKLLGTALPKRRIFLLGGVVAHGILGGEQLEQLLKPFLRIGTHVNVDVTEVCGGPGRLVCRVVHRPVSQHEVAIFP